MPHKAWTLAATGLWLWASASGLAAATGARFTVDKVWQTDDGLPQNSVIAMTQTRDGYLWLGTLLGLVRFDGMQFTVFDENNTPGLASSRIVSLFEDSQGGLWIGTETAGVALLQDGQVISTGIGRGSRDGRLAAACEDATGAVWLYTANGELWRCANGRFNKFIVAAGRPSLCRALIAEKSGPLWVGTDWRLTAVSPPPDATLTALPVTQVLPAGKLDFLLAREQGGYWRLGDSRVQQWRTNQLERDFGPYPWSRSAPPVAACEDRQGNLVVGTYGDGVYWFDSEGQATRISTEEGLSHSSAMSLVVDREGSLWVGSNGGGLNRVKRRVFATLAESRDATVQSVCEDGQGGLWIGYNGDRIDRWSGGVRRQYGVRPNASVRAVFVDRDQRVWAGVWSAQGPHLFHWLGDRFQPVAGAEAVTQDVSAIHQDRQGRLWVGTQGGLARWDGRAWRVFTTRDGLSSDEVTAIADDGEETLWIGTRGGGLNCLRQGRFTAFHKQAKEGLPSEDISSLWLDDQQVLWIGTASGLGRFHRGRWTRYTIGDGLVSNSLGYLAEDGEGNLWIGSNAGIMHIAKKLLNDFASQLTNSVVCRAYGKADGLPTSECTQGSQPAACRAWDGRLWFPTIKGLVSVNPAHLVVNTQPPPVMIESVLIEGREQNTNRLRSGPPPAVTVPAGKEHVEIRYTSLNLAVPERARFKYRLEHHETIWTEAGSVRSAHYSKLPPRRYRFQVTACNEDGVWNETGATLELVVEPPFWRTWWFLLATVAGVLGVIVAGVHYFSTQRLQRQVERLRQQEALEKERARIARDIHDQLGASLTQVSLLGELVESDKHSPDDVQAHARQISQTARDTTRTLDEIVWTVNPSNDTLEGLVTYVCKYAQEFLAVAGLRYRLDTPAQLPAAAISPEVRHNVFLAVKEAVTNVVRHAQASSVWVRLRLEPGRFALEVEDNGRGPAGTEEKAAQTRNGLRNMRKRMEDIGGSFAIRPAPERGTIICLTAPLGHP